MAIDSGGLKANRVFENSQIPFYLHFELCVVAGGGVTASASARNGCPAELHQLKNSWFNTARNGSRLS